MSRPRKRTEMVRRAAVAGFLGMEPEEIARMIAEDDLPVVKLPGRQRSAIRIFLPDLHVWLMIGGRLCRRLASYEEFRRAFFAAQETEETPNPATTR